MPGKKTFPRKGVKATVYTYTVLFEPAAEGGYTVCGEWAVGAGGFVEK